MAKNASESLLARLKNASRASGVPMEQVMRRYAHDRLLRLLSDSAYSDGYCLKGGVLLASRIPGGWSRPTEDIDFNGMDGSKGVEHLERVLEDICSAHDGSDGLLFDVGSLKVMKDRAGPVPGGKVSLAAHIGRARINLRVDVGYGNAVTPSVETVELDPVLPSEVSALSVRAYPLETVISEKFHAMHRHGEANTRVKDYFDVWQISRVHAFDGDVLASAISRTFSQHGDEVPDAPPALSREFGESRSAAAQWAAFGRLVNAASEAPFGDVVDRVAAFVLPAAHAARGGTPAGRWEPEEGWDSTSAPAP